MNERLTVYDWLELYAKDGHTQKVHNLYFKQVIKLFNDGFHVRRLGRVAGYPNEHQVMIDWSNAVPGTLAYKYLLQAQAAVA